MSQNLLPPEPPSLVAGQVVDTSEKPPSDQEWRRGEYVFQPGVNRFDTEKEQRHMPLTPEELDAICPDRWH